MGLRSAVQQVWRDIEAVISVRRRPELLVPLHLNAILTHQPADTAVPNFKAQFLEFLCHAWATIAGQRQGELLANLRKALYMPALVATRVNPDMTRKYNQLIEAGKEKKVALTAIMRKLLVMANALLRGNRMWTETRP